MTSSVRISTTVAVVAIASAVAGTALTGGAFALGWRAAIGVAAWWLVAVALVLRLWSPRAERRPTLVAAALLAVFSIWSALSAAWSDDPHAAWIEADRALVYLGGFLAVLVLRGWSSASTWRDGLGAGIAIVAILAVASRCFPQFFDQPVLPPGIVGVRPRLSYPLGYWNGLAALCGIGLALLLAAAIAHRARWLRGLVLAPVPFLAAAVYLTSSRGGALAAIVGGVATVVVAGRRWAALSALVLAAASGAAAVWIVAAHPELVDLPTSPEARAQGGTVASLLLLAAIGTALAWGGLSALGARLTPPPRSVGRALAAGAAVVAVAGVVALDPVGRARSFAQPQQEIVEGRGYVAGHLLSSTGNGRWQHWSAAVDQWRTEPVRGTGAGTYEAWWLQHGDLPLFVTEAHSLFLEVLGELGLVGLALLLASLAAAAWALVQTKRRCETPVATSAAAGFSAFLAAAAVDWMWELTIVPLVAFAAVAAAVGTGAAARPTAFPARRAIPGALLCGAIIAAQAVPALANARLESSRAAFARGDLEAALDDATAARAIDRWWSAPYVQQALIAEAARDLGTARQSLAVALRRDPTDWRSWLIQARIATKQGDVALAEASLARAAALNPRSPLFRGN